MHHHFVCACSWCPFFFFNLCAAWHCTFLIKISYWQRPQPHMHQLNYSWDCFHCWQLTFLLLFIISHLSHISVQIVCFCMDVQCLSDCLMREVSLFTCLCFTASLCFYYFLSPWKNPDKAVPCCPERPLTDFPLWLHQPINTSGAWRNTE